MKAIYCLAVIFLCACESLPSRHTEAVKETPSVPYCAENCYQPPILLNMSGQPCNLFAWQTFLNWVLTSTEEERKNMFNVLDMRFAPDKIKKLILLSASADSPPTITDAHQHLSKIAEALNSPLGSMLNGYVLHNEQRLKLTQINQQTRQENETLKKQSALLKEQLLQLQSKINALTEIEQQINDGTPNADHVETPDHD